MDARTDLFSVGCILYQMCTGKQPFPGKNTFEIISALANLTPKSMRELNPQIPEGMVQLVAKLLEKDRERRLSSAEHIIQGLTLLEKNPAHSFLKKSEDAAAAPNRPAPNTSALTAQAPAAQVPGVSPRAFEFTGNDVIAERQPKVRSIAKSKGLPMGAWIGIGVGASVLVAVIVLIFMLGKGGVPDKQAMPQIAEAVKPKPPALPPAVINGPAPPPGVKPIVKVEPPPELKPPVVAASRPEITNSLGMKLVQIDPGSFELSVPRRKIEITMGFHIGKYEVTRGQFKEFVRATGFQSKGGQTLDPLTLERSAMNASWEELGFPQGDDHPVANVDWQDAKEFCKWLSEKEGKTYTLPTGAEWEYCCRAGTDTTHFAGDTLESLAGFANASDQTLLDKIQPDKKIPAVPFADGFAFTAPVGSFQPNRWGLHDTLGNVYEWSEDYVKGDQYQGKDPVGDADSNQRTARGGSFHSLPSSLSSSGFAISEKTFRNFDRGFRVVLREEGKAVAVKPPDPPVVPPPPVVKDVAAKKPEIVNSLGMKLVAIQPGTFQMGSPENEAGRGSDEFRHEVELTKGFYIGKYEVTRAEFKQFWDSGYRTMPERTGFGAGYVAETKQFERQKGFNWRSVGYEQADDHPVVCLEWKDAVAFCDWLSQKEGKTYTLPTEAEWEYCCRAGTTSVYYWGEKYTDVSAHENFPEPLGERFTRPVGLSKGNAWGLHDMVGNVSEWTQDGTPNDFYKNSPRKDPVGSINFIGRAVRGGFFQSQPKEGRSAYRRVFRRNESPGYVGFRIVLREEPAKQVGEVKPPEPMPEVKPPEPQVKAEITAATTTKELLNSLGMKLIRIEPGKFQMGSPDDESGRTASETRHEVELTKPLYMGKFEVTQDEYEKIMQKNPSYFSAAGGGKKEVEGIDTTRFPVESVTWKNAHDFCKQLTDKERADGKIGNDLEYTLPTEAEWEYACRAGAATPFSFGATISTEQANFPGDAPYGAGPTGVVRKKPVVVGSLGVNAWGFADMHGNIAEWCEDGYQADFYGTEPAKVDPLASAKGANYVSRGGSYLSNVKYARSAARIALNGGQPSSSQGFRVALRSTRDAAAVAEVDIPAGKVQKEFVSSIGMKLVAIAPGTFLMGSPPEELNRMPEEVQHAVEITTGFYMGRYEVTQDEYAKVMNDNPSSFSANGVKKLIVEGLDTRTFPVETVSWEQAKAFCKALTDRDRKAGKLKGAMYYSLPTEAEWEYCCRAGTTGAFNFDVQSHGANVVSNDNAIPSLRRPTFVGKYAPNQWGLYDMHGNVAEFCEDAYVADFYSRSPKKDPIAFGVPFPRPSGRGGGWLHYANTVRCAQRMRNSVPGGGQGVDYMGFRVVLRLAAKK